VLEDGTRITLKHGGVLDYPRHFGKAKREVHLDGEAFFEVSKDSKRPFFVYNNNLVTEVLGTSFNVKAVRNGVEVAVSTGRVAVYENDNKIPLSPREKLENGVIVTPNQKVTYYEQARHFVTSIVDTPMPVPSIDEKKDPINFVYDDMPLSTVLASIEKAYNIEIVLENESLKNCPFTGDLTKPSLYTKLEFICQALGASYEIKGTKILLKGGKSCN
jgi:ferric-dicitrate binding protein FerR (iron transport regulator)